MPKKLYQQLLANMKNLSLDIRQLEKHIAGLPDDKDQIIELKWPEDTAAKKNFALRAFFYQAVRDHDLELVKILLNIDKSLIHSTSPYTTSNETALHILCWEQKQDDRLVEFLLTQGAKLTTCERQFGNTPLLNAIACNKESYAKLFIATALKTCPAILDQVDTNPICQNTPLMLAVKMNMTDVVLQLLATDFVDVNFKSLNGFSILHYAAMIRNPVILNALLKAGADITAVNQFGATPLDYYLYRVQPVDHAVVFSELRGEVIFNQDRPVQTYPGTVLKDLVHLSYHRGFDRIEEKIDETIAASLAGHRPVKMADVFQQHLAQCHQHHLEQAKQVIEKFLWSMIEKKGDKNPGEKAILQELDQLIAERVSLEPRRPTFFEDMKQFKEARSEAINEWVKNWIARQPEGADVYRNFVNFTSQAAIKVEHKR